MQEETKALAKKRAAVLAEAEAIQGDAQVPDVRAAVQMIRDAVHAKMPVDIVERLLDMRRELRAEYAEDQYYESLARFQAACPTITKSRIVYDKHDVERYRYAPLEQIVAQVKRLLKRHGFSYTIYVKQTAELVTAVCRVHHVAGHSEETEFSVPVGGDYMTAQQKVASSLTYAKRYAFCNAFGIMTGDDDDDANAPSVQRVNGHTDGDQGPRKRQAPQAGKKKEADEKTEKMKKLGAELRAIVAKCPNPASKRLLDARLDDHWKKRDLEGLETFATVLKAQAGTWPVTEEKTDGKD